MSSICIIPARMGSSRFPGKPLEKILGKEMIAYCYENAVNSQTFEKTYIATCDEVIQKFCQKNNMNVVMTSDKHERCTSRTLEAVINIEKNIKKHFKDIVMLQGDEPLITSDMLKKCSNALNSYSVVNLMARATEDEAESIDEVKVVINEQNDAIYFSRAKVPETKDSVKVKFYKQVCAIGFSREMLIKFESFSPSNLEIVESIDMNRFIENKTNIKMVEVFGEIVSVDTLSDLKKVEKILNEK